MNNTNKNSSADFNETQEDWRSAAAGWRRSHDIIEGEKGGKLLSAKLVELARIGPGDAVLDVAGGYGEPSLTAANVVGSEGRVLCNDIGRDMLAFGRERAAAAGLNNVEFVECDAAELDFEAGSFDAVLSRAGLMFVPDVAGTLERLHAFLKPGGRLAASVWGPPPTVEMVAAIPVIFEELETPPPPFEGPGIFALADADHLAALVKDAGFRDVEIGTLTVIYETDTPEQFTEFVQGLAPAMITDLIAAQPPEVQKRVWDRVTQTYAKFQQEDSRVRTENQAILVAGTK